MEDFAALSFVKINYAGQVHANPQLYKYVWWVVAEDELPVDFPLLFPFKVDGSLSSPWLGEETSVNEEMTADVRRMVRRKELSFGIGAYQRTCIDYIRNNYQRLCMADALERMDLLEQSNQSYIIVNKELPRIGIGSPVDAEHNRWEGREWACGFDEDEDPVVGGYK